MRAVVACPSCGRKLKVPDELMGKEVRCADCAGTFLAEKPPPAAPPQSSALVPARTRDRDDEFDDDDRDDRRARRRSRRSSDWEPHRGGMLLAFGIISLVVGVIGIVPGILAWVWGGKDLKKIDSGQMDPEGRSLTQIGYILGIIGTILQTLMLLGLCVYIIVVAVVLCAVGISAPSKVSAPPPAHPPPRQTTPLHTPFPFPLPPAGSV